MVFRDAAVNVDTLLVAVVVSVIAPVIQSHFVNRARRYEKKLDWQRQDEVAAKAEEAAKLLLAANELVAENANVINGKLDQIHTLVNSNMTAAMKAELEATVQKLVLMRKIVDRDRADDIKVLPEALKAIRDVEEKIEELTATLNDRLRQTAIADSKVT